VPDTQLIQQVLSMTDAQIAALDETSRNTILQIVSLQSVQTGGVFLSRCAC